jgi:cytochrome c peroxidase
MNLSILHICHAAPLFTDDLFHNTGVAFVNGIFKEEERFGHTKTLGQGKPEEIGAFKTPTLRNVVSRAPYMHDGSIKTLEEVIDFYNDGGRKNPYLDPEILRLGLTVEDKSNLLAFLKTLDGEGFEETAPEVFPK